MMQINKWPNDLQQQYIKLDSLQGKEKLDALVDLAKGLQWAFGDDSWVITQMAAGLSAEYGTDEQKATLERLYGDKARKAHDFKLAIKHYQHALWINKEDQGSNETANCYNYIGMCYMRLGDFNRALECQLKHHTANELSGIKERLAQSHNNLGTIYLELNDCDKSAYHFSRSLQIAKANDNLYAQFNSHNNLGLIYREKKDYQKALEHFETSIAIQSPLLKDTDKAPLYNNIGVVYLSLGQHQKALENCQKAGDLLDTKNFRQVTVNMNDQAEALRLLGRYNESEQILLKAWDIAQANQLMNPSRRIINQLTLVYQKLSEYKKAFEWSQKSLELTRKIFNHDMSTKLAETEARYQTELYRIQNTELSELNKKLKQKEQELTRAMKSKDLFYSVIAHDMRAPLSGIIGLTHWTVSNPERQTKEELLDGIEEIHKVAVNHYQMLNSLLLWAKSQTGRLHLEPRAHLVKDLLEGVENVFNPLCNKKGITYSHNYPKDCQIWADGQTVEVVLRNLVSNALKFTSEGGKISIKAYLTGNQTVIEVTDTGRGMEEQDLERLFDLESTFTRPGTQGEPGSGLGLLLCHEFMQLNNGTITVKSQLQQGTTFILSFNTNQQ